MIIRIADPSDGWLAPYRDVADRQALERRGRFVVEGRLIARRLLEDSRFEVESVLVTPAAADAMRDVFEARPDTPVLVCEPALVESVTGYDFHRGCLALAQRPFVLPPLDSFARARRLLVLEGVGNPDNVGGLFRTALAFGVGAIVLDPASADPLYRKAIRTSMGATLRLPFTRVAQWPAGLDVLRRDGFQIIALTPDAGATDVDDLPVSAGAKLALLLGSEGDGLSAGALQYADARLRIPIDPTADSLNVVVAAGVALHTLRCNAER